YYLMIITMYSNHPNCISDKWRDGYTATMTPIREGVAAINVDYIDGKWVVKSLLKLGDKIYIEGMGNYSAEDTGRFAERNHRQDMWTVDIYVKSYEEAVEFGRQLKKVYVIERG
ncbi:MAG: 3D domain-containing protein, partial [Ignavibacteria bacterium]|nr:3D domain-containing protein [Ignavibacteria bacterium]